MMSRKICFVCGSIGAETLLYIKQRDKGAFFPFLEHHDPPKGSRLPGVDGSVDSCRVCDAFLTQQWDSYEQSKTPTIKRLYWLKRADNGHFTGAEMRLQGEYIAQVMGLQYQPGVPVFDGTNSPPSMSYGDESPPHESRSRYSYPQDSVCVFNSHQKMDAVPSKPSFKSMTGNSSEGVLDLSVTKKTWAKAENVNNVNADYKKIKSETFVCFTCGLLLPVFEGKTVNAVQQANKEPFFPFLKECMPPKGALPITQSAQVCSSCRTSLYQQWQAYEMSGIPLHSRSYRLSEDMPIPLKTGHSDKEYVKHKESFSSSQESPTHNCYLCGIANPENLIRKLDTLPPKISGPYAMFFPIVRDLRRPSGAQPLKSDGTVLVCFTCFGHLQHQWQVQEVQGVPLYHRNYSLQFLETVTKKQSDRKTVDSFDISQPLNIQISVSSPDVSKNQSIQSAQRTAQGLLAIAAPVVTLNNAESAGPPPLSSPSPASINPQASRLNSESRRLSVESGSVKTSISMPHPLQHVTAIPKKVCFLCGEKCIVAKSHILCSYPTRHEPKVPNTQTVPFFPFLANRDPAASSDPMTDDGTVSACNFCYALLQKQYNEYEESKTPSDSNRWLRKYLLTDYTCYVCGTVTDRKSVRSLEVAKFSFLKDHNCAPSALILDEGENICVCRSCFYSLEHQYSEYERMGVPSEMRKYNWINLGQTAMPDDSNDETSNQGEDLDRKALVSVKVEDALTEGKTSMPPLCPVSPTQAEASMSTGVAGQGSKLPPLTMMSPASTKLPRNTATVPPLNQVSPSNGTTSSSTNAALIATPSSSFAARLRKLATQAMDTPDETAAKPVSNVSPRTSTPKRGPPPLVYSSHSTATLTSPPVVTIAPTQTHPSTVSSDSRQGVERSHSVHSTTSLHFEPVNLKPDRDQRSHSTHSREDDRDRLPGKENLVGQASRRVTPHSTPGSMSPLISSSRDDAHMRGFQPYRSGEEMRHAVPPAFTLDPSSYPYPAFLPPHAFPPAFRLDDQLMLERYRMMPPPYVPLGHPGMMPHPGVHPLLSGARYPTELLHQFQFAGQAGCLPDHMSPVALERQQRYEEERHKEFEREKERDREREKEREKEKEREAALRRQKERERLYEKEREYERQQAHDRVQRERDKTRPHDSHMERRMEDQSSRMSDSGRSGDVPEGIAAKFGSITQGTPRDSGYGDRSHHQEYGDRAHHHQESTYNGRWEDNYKQISQDAKNKIKHQDLQKIQNRGNYRQDPEKRYSLSNSNRDTGHHTNPPPLVPPKSHDRDVKPTKPLDNNLFRPFDNKGLSNGVNSSHCVDYSRSRQDNKICDRMDAQSRYSTLDIVKQEHNDVFQKTVADSHPISRPSDSGSALLERNKVELTVPQVHRNHLLQSPERIKKEMISKSKNDMIPNYKPNMSFVFPFDDNFRQKLESQVEHVVSKLDLDEKRLQAARARGTCSSDSDFDEGEMEEKRKEKLLLVTSGPPLKLHTPRSKMKFLSNLELTSQGRRKELQYERIRRHRRLQHESSTSPIEVEASVSPPLAMPSSELTEQLCKETEYKPKCGFLNQLDLEAVRGERKQELEQIRQICQKDKVRRERNFSQREELPSPTDKAMKSAGHGVKRKLSDMDDSPETSTPHPKDRKCAPERKYSILGSQYHSQDRKSLLFPDNHNRQLSREFAQEFHESVLETTKKELANRLGPNRSKSGEDQSKSSLVDFGANHHGSTQSGTSSRSHDFMQWPGIDGVLESYQRHIAELQLEKQILLDRCRRLKSDNKDLNKTAENLTHRMTELCEKKRNFEEERSQNQGAVDKLKQCLKRLH
ncbi:hypothetical protein ScPMuIL_001065 [Solemya velum]